MDSLDPWAILYTQEEWALHIPQPISTNMSHPVMTTTTCDNDECMTVGSQPQLSFPLTPLTSPGSLVVRGPSGQPMAMPGQPTVAIDATRHIETKGEHQFGVSGSTKDDRLIRPQPEAEDNREWFKHHPPDALLTRRPPLHLHVLKMTQVGLLGGHRHHPAAFGPTRTNSEPLAPSKRPNMATATPKRDRNEGKHLLGVLKGKEQKIAENPRIAVGNESKWFSYHSPDYTTSQTLAPSLSVPHRTCIVSPSGSSTSTTSFSTLTRNAATQRLSLVFPLREPSRFDTPRPSTFAGVKVDVNHILYWQT